MPILPERQEAATAARRRVGFNHVRCIDRGESHYWVSQGVIKDNPSAVSMSSNANVMISKVLFTSRSTHNLGHVSDLEIFRTAAERNRKANITGLLLRGETWYAQVLEGVLSDLETLMARILQDRRHAQIQHWYARPRNDRIFTNWHAEHWGVPPADQDALFEKLASNRLHVDQKIEVMKLYGRRRTRDATARFKRLRSSESRRPAP
ncbi:BLUF domain-containing protein [Aliishimia ponticola]|uniref:BLUF domain-containing protein n=1 Tax=Aliishimia ponticola TaxID=2499833 RepID=A0A4S4N8U4_9RHOB|nr:BLUF domain-containing protein [Aliishimia ponticola]THH34478.1 BLUF domain-containing protein [Aliishimia ponticola]